MGCQAKCPWNRNNIEDVVQLGTVSEDETTAILKGEFSQELSASPSEKLSKFPGAASEEYFPLFTRNLGVLPDR